MKTNDKEIIYSIGIDVGSTTVKIIATDEKENIIYEEYKRHFANVKETTLNMLKAIYAQYGNRNYTVSVTGSGGLNLAKKMQIKFVQEVVAVTFAVKKVAPHADVVIELGGEDAKIIYLKKCEK